jgi:hypothetical protein
LSNVLELKLYAVKAGSATPKRSQWRLARTNNADVKFPGIKTLRKIFKKAYPQTKKGNLYVRATEPNCLIISMPTGLKASGRKKLLEAIERRMKVVGTLPAPELAPQESAPEAVQQAEA